MWGRGGEGILFSLLFPLQTTFLRFRVIAGELRQTCTFVTSRLSLNNIDARVKPLIVYLLIAIVKDKTIISPFRNKLLKRVYTFIL
jgi:hypothetical protein